MEKLRLNLYIRRYMGVDLVSLLKGWWRYVKWFNNLTRTISQRRWGLVRVNFIFFTVNGYSVSPAGSGQSVSMSGNVLVLSLLSSAISCL